MKALYAKLARAPHAYALLGVHTGSTPAEVKVAHRTLAAQLHPDRNRDKAAAEWMAAVNVAAAQVGDPAYHRGLLASPQWTRCPQCAGVGHARKGRGFKGAVLTGCPDCAGSGVVLKEKRK